MLLFSLDVRVKRVFHHNEGEFRFNETRGENFIKIPSTNLHNNGRYTNYLSSQLVIFLKVSGLNIFCLSHSFYYSIILVDTLSGFLRSTKLQT